MADEYIHRANNISDMPELSLLTIILLFVLNLSLIVLINLLIFSLPLWSLIGHSICWINRLLQNSLNRLLLNIVAGSVRFVFGIPCFDM